LKLTNTQYTRATSSSWVTAFSTDYPIVENYTAVANTATATTISTTVDTTQITDFYN
jgi:hypothetical protein